MRAAAVIAALLLVGCQTCPVKPPETVMVTVREYVPVPEDLTRPCAIYEVRAQTYGESVRAANRRKASLIECNSRLREIRALGEPVESP